MGSGDMIRTVAGMRRVEVSREHLESLPEVTVCEPEARDELSMAAEYLGLIFVWVLGNGQERLTLDQVGMRTLVVISQTRPDLYPASTLKDLGQLKGITPQGVRDVVRQFEDTFGVTKGKRI